jgi:uncharacterized protein
MKERSGYEQGVPCWVESRQDDLRAASAFYAGLFSWEVESADPGDPTGADGYLIGRHCKRAVAGISKAPREEGKVGWLTYVATTSLAAMLDEIVGNEGRVLEELPHSAAGHGAIVMDTVGATFGLWEAGQRFGAELVNEEWAWVLSVLHTPDLEPAKEFYASAFGWVYDDIETGDGVLTLCRLPGYVGGREDQPGPPDACAVMLAGVAPAASDSQARSRWLAEFWVDDLTAIGATAEKLGGAVVDSSFARPGFTAASLLEDPSGASFVVSTLNAP